MSSSPYRTAAKHAGRCATCQHPILRDQPIVGFRLNWSHEDCWDRGEEARDLLRALESHMLERYRVALGVWGVPDGATGTHTRREFLRVALEVGALTAEDARLLAWYWRPVLDRDLSD